MCIFRLPKLLKLIKYTIVKVNKAVQSNIYLCYAGNNHTFTDTYKRITDVTEDLSLKLWCMSESFTGFNVVHENPLTRYIPELKE